MSKVEADFGRSAIPRSSSNGWRELWLKEDWWAVWLGLGIVVVGLILFAHGGSWRWVAVVPPRWTTFAQLGAHFADAWLRYLVQFVLWAAAFSVALGALGHKPREFLPSFVFLYVLAVGVFVLGQWDSANYYNLEPPLVALVLGLVITNVVGLPRWLDAGFRTEFYIKTGIILLGATLPFTLIIWAGPVAILQASIVSIATFLVIYWVGLRLGLDRRLAATLGAGGAVCGVSASIAIAGAVGAKKDDAPIAITLVILWAIVMIFVLPIVARLLGIAERCPVARGSARRNSPMRRASPRRRRLRRARRSKRHHRHQPDQSLFAFTLMKVVGRDVWIGIWAFILAIVATTRWEQRELGRKANAAEIWWRFPKFVIGFLVASLLITWASAGYSLADYNKTVVPNLVAPIKDLRTWAFIFCFLSIGLTTRFRDLASAGRKPFLAFSSGVVVNVILGFILSAWVFAAHWTNLGQ